MVARSFCVAALAGAVMAVCPAVSRAQTPAGAATVQAYITPQGRTLQLLVRVPFAGLPDVDYPRRGASGLDLVDLASAHGRLRDAAAAWVAGGVEMYEGGARLQGQVTAVMESLPSDTSFASYEEALAHVTGSRLPADTEFQWKEGLLDLLVEYPIASDRSRFSIRATLPRPGVRAQLVLRYRRPGGGARAFEFSESPGLVRLDPSWGQVARQFAGLGFRRIFDGPSHLLFLLGLAIPFRRLRSLVAVVICFTVAHSITLVASAYNLAPDTLWFPPLVDTLIAASILYLALENVVASQVRRRHLIAFVFGLVHGFGFSFALRESLQLAGSHFPASLVSFTIGLELGQLVLLALAIPVLRLVVRLISHAWTATAILSGLVAHTAWHWTLDRYGALSLYRVEWPALDLNLAIVSVRWAMVLVLATGVFWFLSEALGQAVEDT